MNVDRVWMEFVQRPAWFDLAACRGRGAGMFFPGTGPVNVAGRAETAVEAAAKQFCAACPVRAECLAYGMEERHGIWGGRTPSERGRIREVTPPLTRIPIAQEWCGSDAGYKRHRRNGEDACEDCLRAHAHRQQDTRPSRSKASA